MEAAPAPCIKRVFTKKADIIAGRLQSLKSTRVTASSGSPPECVVVVGRGTRGWTGERSLNLAPRGWGIGRLRGSNDPMPRPTAECVYHARRVHLPQRRHVYHHVSEELVQDSKHGAVEAVGLLSLGTSYLRPRPRPYGRGVWELSADCGSTGGSERSRLSQRSTRFTRVSYLPLESQ